MISIQPNKAKLLNFDRTPFVDASAIFPLRMRTSSQFWSFCAQVLQKRAFEKSFSPKKTFCHWKERKWRRISDGQSFLKLWQCRSCLRVTERLIHTCMSILLVFCKFRRLEPFTKGSIMNSTISIDQKYSSENWYWHVDVCNVWNYSSCVLKLFLPSASCCDVNLCAWKQCTQTREDVKF